MATYEDLELDNEIVELIEAKSSEPGFAVFITPEGLRAWMNAGGNLAKEINGIGPKSVKKVLAALDKLEVEPPAVVEELQPPAVVEEQKREAPATPPVAPEQKQEDTQVEPSATVVQETVETAPAIEPKLAEESPEVQYVTISLPVGPMPTAGYDVQQAQSGKLSVSDTGSRHLQMRLRPEEAMVFLRLREGVRLANERLADGRPAWNTPDVQRIIAAKVLSELAE